MKQNSKKLIDLMAFISIFGFIIISVAVIFIFTHETTKSYNESLKELSVENNKGARIDAEYKIQRIVEFTKIYEKELEEQEQQKVKYRVDEAIYKIQEIYKNNSSLSKEAIFQKIHDQFKDERFFSDKTGYFFIYTLKGKCLLLPTTPKLEGTNQINFLDGKKEHTIQKAIKIVKSKDEGFATWWWYKIGEKKMKEKIGFVKIFKPLDIFIGTARYKEDIVANVKERIIKYLIKLKKDEYGYIFAYDFSGNSMLVKRKKLIRINSWNDSIGGEHIVRNAIRGAKIVPDGFFMQYLSSDKKVEFSYVKLIPDLDLVLGTKVETKRELYALQKNNLKAKLVKTIKNTIIITALLLVFMSLLFIFLVKIVKKLIMKLEYNVALKTEQLLEQKSIFETLFHKSHDGILLTKNKKIVDCNEAMHSMFGYKTKEDFINEPVPNLFPKIQEDGRDSMEKLEELIEIAREKGFNEFEFLALRADKTKVWINVTIIGLNLHEDPMGYFVFRDIDKRKRIEKDFVFQQKKLLFQATHDMLTSLPNRMLLMDRLHESLKKAKREKSFTEVLFLDIDNFKIINDAFGHEQGDLLLIQISSVLRMLVREVDIVSRFGGDEFVMVLNGFKNKDDSAIIINKIINRFQKPFYIQNSPFNITFSIGVSVYPDDSLDQQELLKYADMAMYGAKNSGKNRYVYYEKSMNVDILKHMKIEQEIRDGIKNEEFILYYQPQFEVGTEKIIGFEALVRWQHPTRGLVFPDYFIQIAENSSLIVPLGELISKIAIHQIANWHKQGLNPGIVSINFTSKQLESVDFFDNLQQIIKEAECRPEWIEADLIERHIMSNTEKTSKLLDRFKNIGIPVAIDDFGTGYSSLGYLKYLDVSKLKIDKKFIDDLAVDKKDRAIVKSIINLSKGLDLKVIAEGVETKKQYEILKRLDCQIIQGYYFSRPVPTADAETLLRKKSQERTLLLK